ncbi:MAG: SOS response-associated peptidase [Bacilli bacterium]
MCGRVTITVPREEISKYLYDYFSINNFDIEMYSPRYNVAPSQNVLSIINDGQNYRAGFLKWGFIPEFSKDEKTILINARSETIDSKFSFKNSFIYKRCIIPVDGFYEWKREGTSKTPMRIHMQDKSIFALAGIWSTFIKPDNSKVFTFSIITCEANKLMQTIHDRMPVILDKDKIHFWLNPQNKDPNALKEILLPYDDKKMIAYKVSNEVNSPKNDYESLVNKL